MRRVSMIVAAVILVGPLVVLGGIYVLSEAELRDVAKDPPFGHQLRNNRL